MTTACSARQTCSCCSTRRCRRLPSQGLISTLTSWQGIALLPLASARRLGGVMHSVVTSDLAHKFNVPVMRNIVVCIVALAPCIPVVGLASASAIVASFAHRGRDAPQEESKDNIGLEERGSTVARTRAGRPRDTSSGKLGVCTKSDLLGACRRGARVQVWCPLRR